MSNDNTIDTAKLRALDSSEAAEWLIEKFPHTREDYLRGIAVVSKRTWKKRDQIKLARHFLTDLPDQSPWPYSELLKVIRASCILSIVREQIVGKHLKRKKMLEYNLKTAFMDSSDFRKNRSEINARLKEIFHRDNRARINRVTIGER